MRSTAFQPKGVDIGNLLRSGLPPSEIAQRLNKSVETTIQQIRMLVGDGTLRFSEIYFSLPADKRELIGVAADDEKKIDGNSSALSGVSKAKLAVDGLTPEDLVFYRSIRQRPVLAGDLYVHISETELALHDMVSSVLVKKFGDGESGYWRQGVPMQVRIGCQERREQDEDPADSPFQYTMLLDLFQIIQHNWQLFIEAIPNEYGSNSKSLRKDLAKLNGIRNTVMHPVKRRHWSEDDFAFVRKLHAAFETFRKK